MPSARPTKHAHTPMRTAKRASEMGTGRASGALAGDHTPSRPNRMPAEARGIRQASRQAPAGGSHQDAKYTAAASTKANGASKAVWRESTLRYASPNPRSSKPDPAPVAAPPSTQRRNVGTPGNVEDTTASVPRPISAGTPHLTCGLLIKRQSSSERKADRNIVRNRHAVDTANARPGTGAPSHVTTLTADPTNMRYTQARASAKPIARRPNRSRSDTPSKGMPGMPARTSPPSSGPEPRSSMRAPNSLFLAPSPSGAIKTHHRGALARLLRPPGARPVGFCTQGHAAQCRVSGSIYR